MSVPSQLGTVAIACVTLAAACTRTRYACPPPPRPENVDSLNATVPVRSYSDASVSRDSIVGLVRRAGARSPVRNVEVRLHPDTTVRALTDSTGRFALPMPAVSQAVLETRQLGYIRRRDTLQVVQLQGRRLEVTVFDAYALGDIDAVPVCMALPH
jgi:hypothetical protein